MSDPAVQFAHGGLVGYTVGELYAGSVSELVPHAVGLQVSLVFVPKYRRKAIYGDIRRGLGAIFHELARQKECRIVEGHLVNDHVHMCIEIPPKHAVSSVVGFLKGKSAIAIARKWGGRQKNFNGENFWARGYAVSTVGFELEAVRKYIREQETQDQQGRF